MAKARKLNVQGCGQDSLEEILATVANSGQRVLVEVHGIKVAIIPSDDLALLQKLEEEALDRADAQDAEEVLRDPKWIPWDQVKRQLKS